MKNSIARWFMVGASLCMVAACASQDPYAYEQKSAAGNQGSPNAMMRSVMGLPSTHQSQGPVTGPLGGLDYPGGAVGYMSDQEDELRTSLQNTGVEVTRVGESIRLTLPDPITFEFDSARLQPKFMPILDEVATVLARYDQTVLEVHGHADFKGSDAYNQKLSERRAGAVKSYLAGHGVDDQRIDIFGWGETKPLAPERTDAARAKNRRVELDIGLPQP